MSAFIHIQFDYSSPLRLGFSHRKSTSTHLQQAFDEERAVDAVRRRRTDRIQRSVGPLGTIRTRRPRFSLTSTYRQHLHGTRSPGWRRASAARSIDAWGLTCWLPGRVAAAEEQALPVPAPSSVGAGLSRASLAGFARATTNASIVSWCGCVSRVGRPAGGTARAHHAAVLRPLPRAGTHRSSRCGCADDEWRVHVCC